MNRRDFMRRMFGLGVTIAVPALVTDPLSLFFDMEKIDALNPNLYGMDWGVNDGTYGTWNGIRRAPVSQWSSKSAVGPGAQLRADIIELIRRIKVDIKENPLEIIIANEDQIRIYKELKSKDYK